MPHAPLIIWTGSEGEEAEVSQAQTSVRKNADNQLLEHTTRCGMIQLAFTYCE